MLKGGIATPVCSLQIPLPHCPVQAMVWWVFVCLLFISTTAVPTPGQWVASHNKRRCLHAVPDFVWHASVAQSARRHADTCSFEHSTPAIYGENLYAGWWSPTAEDVLIGWYDNEVGLYPWDKPGFYSVTGHFTQVVWRNTRTVGCAVCDGGGTSWPYIAVCQYDLAGNIGGQFVNQVSPASKSASQCRATCPEPDPATGYDMTGCQNKFPSACDPKCRAGYWSASPSVYAQCLSNGQWHYNGVCNAFDCFAIPESDKPAGWDFSDCTSNKYEGHCNVKCASGYSGSPSARCNVRAEWEFSGECYPGVDWSPFSSRMPGTWLRGRGGGGLQSQAVAKPSFAKSHIRLPRKPHSEPIAPPPRSRKWAKALFPTEKGCPRTCGISCLCIIVHAHLNELSRACSPLQPVCTLRVHS